MSLFNTILSWAELKDIMRKCGEVTYTDAHYRSGEGRGEVCYSNREEMERCLDEMDGYEINGKQIRLSQGVSNRLFTIFPFTIARLYCIITSGTYM